MCFEKVLRTIRTSNNDNYLGNKINEQSAIIKELKDKYSKFNIDDIIETRIKQAINIINTDNKKVLDEIPNSFTEVKTYTIALKKCFDASQAEVSKLSMKWNQVTADNTRQTEVLQELTHEEDMYKIEVINLTQAFQHEYRNSQSCSNSKMKDIKQILNTLPRMSTPLNQYEGIRIPNPQVLDFDNSKLKNELSTSFHNLEPSMGQALLKEVLKIEQWPHFSGEGEYDHMEFVRGIDMIKEDFELPNRLVTERFNTLFTRSAHRWYIKLRQAHGHQSLTWWKTQIINKWANDAWRFKVETAFEYFKFNADKDKALQWFCQQKDRLIALYPDMSEFMIHRKIVRQCGGALEHAFKSRTTEKSSAEDIINILEEVTTRTRIGSSRVNLKARFNTPWKDSVDKNPKENSNNVKYKSSDIIRNFHICQSTTQLADTCPKKDKEPLGAIFGNDADIILNIERPYPPLLRRPAYPASPQSREDLETHIKELLDLGLIRKDGHNEEVETTTPVIVAWQNGKSRMAGDFRALNTYTVLDRYQIPKIQIALTHISQAVYIATIDALEGFHQNLAPRSRKYLRIIVHCGVYEYLRMPFGSKNAPSHFQRVMNEIFPEELSEGWLIIYIDDIIFCSNTWEEHMYILSRVLTKIQSVNMKTSLKKCHFGFKELKALGQVVSG
ncbi:hypothetical protein O181_059840 [Austropuccinia psidii MF-1]|uniref:Reverse transcriptase domain-containing protein n=1 Tax=Austropuccinia psidii MF-1 TaxID=1389203 RepID=A0A9Q3EC86_9BASI|nr:hypothetical protein [Austropuccinia psidii MF-1]